MNISEETRQKAVDYEVESIHYITEQIGPRESGMPKELEAEEWLKKELDDNGWADSSVIDEFTIARHALVGFTKVIGVILILGALIQLLFLIPGDAGRAASIAAAAIGLVFAVFSFITTVQEFLVYHEFLDYFMDRTKSHNVYAKYEPTGEVKRRIIFNGHVDSAYEWTLMKIKQNVMVGVLVVDIVCLLAMIAFTIVSLVMPGAAWPHIVVACFAVPFFGLFFVCNFKVVVPGANDNLTGTMNAVAVLKCLKESGIRFENTEVCALLTGSEEAGLRGAKAFAKKYKQECTEIPTAIICFDTLRDLEFLTVYDKDMTSLVKNDKDCSILIDKACDKIGHKLLHGGVPFGASDAAALSKQGLKAICVAGQDPLHATYYHNTRDTADNMRPECMRLCLDISLAACEIFDQEEFGK